VRGRRCVQQKPGAINHPPTVIGRVRTVGLDRREMTDSQVSQDPSPRAAYLVLGMHRSGTSAVTQLLALAGADMPRNVMPGDEHNAKGYFEPWKIAMFNDQRLRAAGSAWDDVFAFPYVPLAPDDETRWLQDATEIYRAEFGDKRFPLLKDPRVTALLPLWRQVLDRQGVDARCVIPVRHPLAVAGSLAKRNGFPVEKSVLLWTSYMLAAEAYTRDLPRVFVAYDAVLSDWKTQVNRIEAAHGAALPRLNARAAKAIDGFLSPELRHNDGLGELARIPHVGALVQGVHDWFEAAARDERPSAKPLDTAQAELLRMRAQMGVFVSPVTRDLDATRAELLDVRQKTTALEAELARLRDERSLVEALIDSAMPPAPGGA
jgi:hypothetical protein